MYIVKDKIGEVIVISDTLDYQSNGNPLIDNGMRAIAEILVGEIVESDELPEGWEKKDGHYYEKNNIFYQPEEATIEQEGDE